MTTLKQLGEFGLIDRLISQLNAREDLSEFGLGDDCATIPFGDRTLLLSTDCLVSGRHFDLSFAPAQAAGFRALAVNISDIAAMGGTPTFALISLQAPASTESALIEELYLGLMRCAEQYNVRIVGGNITNAAELAVGITIVGEVTGEPIRRSGAAVGDEIWISGAVGGAAAALRLAQGKLVPVSGEYQSMWLGRLLHPTPRVHLGQLLQRTGLATSMIDVSDGIIQDLQHLTKSSNVSAELDLSAIPLEPGTEDFVRDDFTLASSGDDYELLFTVKAEKVTGLEKLVVAGVALTKIGRIVPSETGNLDAVAAKIRGGYDHFL